MVLAYVRVRSKEWSRWLNGPRHELNMKPYLQTLLDRGQAKIMTVEFLERPPLHPRRNPNPTVMGVL